MPIRSTWALAPLCLVCLQLTAAVADPPRAADAPRAADMSATAPASQAAADLDATRQAFVAALQRIRTNLPDTPDSPALEAYAIHDYLVAARYRRDLVNNPDDALDAAIDTFLQAHAGLPVAHGLRRDWLLSLAQRRRWDLFLPRAAEGTDALLACDRLEGRLATGDTESLPMAALARWSLPQKQPAECNDAFAWLRQRNFITPALAESKARAALAPDGGYRPRPTCRRREASRCCSGRTCWKRRSRL